MIGPEPPLLQLRLAGERDDPLFAWRVIVVSMMLSRTRAKQARPALETMLREWPDPKALADADRERLLEVIRPCGFANQREIHLRGTSRAYHEWLEEDFDPEPGMTPVPGPIPERARLWPGVGRYVEDAVRLVVWRDFEMDEPKDRALAAWHRWNRQS